jgi:hypothetical protein
VAAELRLSLDRIPTRSPVFSDCGPSLFEVSRGRRRKSGGVQAHFLLATALQPR